MVRLQYLLLAIIILVCSCSIKKNIDKNDLVSYILPEIAVKIDSTILKAKKVVELPESKIKYFKNYSDLYIIDSMIFHTNKDRLDVNDQPNFEKDYLQKQKKAWDYFSKSEMKDIYLNYKSLITKIKENEVYTENYIYRGTGYYYYSVINKRRDRRLSGALAYNPQDSLKAQKFMDDFLKSIKF